jgi:hypothetical protein
MEALWGSKRMSAFPSTVRAQDAFKKDRRDFRDPVCPTFAARQD